MLSLLTLSYSSAYPEFPELMESLISERSERVDGIEWIRSRACAGAGQDRKRTRVKPLLDWAFRGMDAGEIRKSLTVLPIRKSEHIGDAMCSRPGFHSKRQHAAIFVPARDGKVRRLPCRSASTVARIAQERRSVVSRKDEHL